MSLNDVNYLNWGFKNAKLLYRKSEKGQVKSISFKYSILKNRTNVY